MLNIILVLLLLHTIFYKKSGILSCGLFGYIGEKDAHTFSWDKFNYLGHDNDDRGGDSIGRMVGEDVVKFINTKKAKTTYEDFVINHKNSEESHMALGHTRKASVGGVSENTAQPIEIELPNAQGKFVMVHNGTIYNWRDLARKYEIDVASKSDSMVLAEIIMNNGYDVLKEYVGAAALIIRDDRVPDTFFVFKGESKIYNKPSEERPLFYYQENEDSMYLSSKEEGLYFIVGDVENVFDFNTNSLYEVYQGRIINETEYDRKDKDQVERTTASRTPIITTSNHSRFNNYGMYNDDYSDSWVTNKDNGGHTINNEELIAPNPWSKIVFSRMRYWRYEHYKFIKMDGIVHLTEDGHIRHSGVYSKHEKTRVYYFYNGVMMKDLECYQKIKKVLPKAKHMAESWANTTSMAMFSSHPVCTLDAVQSFQDIRILNDADNVVMATGIFHPLFSKIKYNVKGGDLKMREITDSYNNAVHTKILKENVPLVLVKSSNSNEEDNIPLVDAETSMGADLENNIKKVDQILNAGNARSDEEDDEYIDTAIMSEINSAISSILMAVDASRSELEIMQVDCKMVVQILENLNTIEDTLMDDKVFKTKKIDVQYEKF